ncbi:Mitochondrial 39-S ribosomal protein L47 (MRP-L47) [Ceratobasidium sp. AG-Ba]|nr:Mitochondrial 39-S ribosomal protein L47 (MRP-L47) [Ceratobasidium sp. AG-Ba]
MASELRRKSFKDLHTLWYPRASVSSRNPKHEARRQAIDVSVFTNINMRNMRCRKSMARIKQVLNERRLAYEAAVELQKRELRQSNWRLPRRRVLMRDWRSAEILGCLSPNPRSQRHKKV